MENTPITTKKWIIKIKKKSHEGGHISVFFIHGKKFLNYLNYPSKSQKNYKCCLDKSVEAVPPKDKTKNVKLKMTSQICQITKPKIKALSGFLKPI